MITGPDTLDSYEALWYALILYRSWYDNNSIICRELAELLGQAKPPTATREDIDKSGLKVIKASELKRYEEEGRVAYNCVEKVRTRLSTHLSCLHADGVAAAVSHLLR